MADENMNVKFSDEYCNDLVAAIDEGTSSTRFLVFSAKSFQVITSHQVNLTAYEPRAGWIEMDPMEILDATKECMEKTCEKLRHLKFDTRKIRAVGITNQRETIVVWDRKTGRPLCDMRTEDLAERLSKKAGSRSALQKRCGLVIHPYFSALKLRWLLDNVPESPITFKKRSAATSLRRPFQNYQIKIKVSETAANSDLMTGTIDTWLIWNLTGGLNCGVYITDVTNASRTMLMNIRSLNWDTKLLTFFELDQSYLPEIRSSSEIYGHIKVNSIEQDSTEFSLNGVPISGCLGDQQ
uniref:glycerol kinase n=1 Tax=Romanomermis culicivorax TaxID=13658 RepID=A0A915HVA8_ROMCU